MLKFLPEKVGKQLNVIYRLCRFDKLTGAWLLVIPCYWGMALAGGTASIAVNNWHKWMLFTLAGIAMRSAGCIWNDIIDRKIDRKVKRTKSRPLAKEEISVIYAVIIAIGLSLFSFILLLFFNTWVIVTAFLSVPFILVYPYSKRWIKLPQIVLGLTFNWGIWLGWFAIIADSGITDSIIIRGYIGTFLPPFLLYIAGFFWTLSYDSIYALQDLNDDKRIGINSSTIWLGKKIKLGLAIFNIICILFIAFAGLVSLADYVNLFILLPFAFHLLFQTFVVNSSNASKVFISNANAGIWASLSIIILVS